MKSLVPYLVLLFAIVLSACREKTETPEKTCEKAALEIYCKYADNTNLTVAFLGDLTVNGKCIDALLLKADNETDWETLKWDFGFMSYDSAAFHCPNDENPVMVGVGIETDFLDDAIFDTLTDISQISDKDIERFTLMVADKMREVMNSFQTPDSLLPNAAVIVGQGPIEQAVTNDTFDDYLKTVARSLVIGMIDERLHPNTTPYPNVQQQNDLNQSIMDDAQSHGHMGYVTAADNDEHALWLFFYDDQEERNTIITHISEDMIFNNKPLPN